MTRVTIVDEDKGKEYRVDTENKTVTEVHQPSWIEERANEVGGVIAGICGSGLWGSDDKNNK